MSNNISILLATYNGSCYLKEQLDSLYSQTYTNFNILVRDDISADNTLKILSSCDLKIIPSNKNVGIQRNFSILLEYALQNSDNKYFMFCDQDDIWKKDKIEKTLAKMIFLEKQYGDIPLLVHSDLIVVDNVLQNNRFFWESEKINPNINSFNRLLMQNTVTGCTVMINRKLAKLALPIPNESIAHDAWFGLVASYFGKIGILNEQTILYRQHNLNSIGAQGFTALYFFNKLLKQNIIQKNAIQAKAFLKIYRDILDEKTIEMLEEFTTLESQSFWQKRKILLKHKLLKQGFLRNLGLLWKI